MTRGTETTERIRVLVADDDADMRMLLRMTLSMDDALLLTAEAVDGERAVALWRQHRPDVTVLDHRMPRLTGLQAAARTLALSRAA